MDHSFQCSFCRKRFKIEKRFMQHACKEMKRDSELRTPTGQAALLFYQKWMKASRRQVPKPEAFLKSSYYNAFLKFAEFARKVKIPDVDAYIRIMTSGSIAPTMWSLNEAYALYIDWMDRKESPANHAMITVDTLYEMADDLDLPDASEVFTNVDPAVVIQLLRQRRLSPWILLKSQKFRVFFTNVCTPEDRMIMESIIRPKYWAEKFTNQPEDVDQMKVYIEALSL
jgi:hypothetical protein